MNRDGIIATIGADGPDLRLAGTVFGHAPADGCPDIGGVTDEVEFSAKVIAIALGQAIGEMDCGAHVVGKLDKLHVQPQQAAHEDGEDEGTVLAIVLVVIEILFEEIDFVMAEELIVGLIVKDRLNEVQQGIDGFAL